MATTAINDMVTTIGVDLGKNVFHIVGRCVAQTVASAIEFERNATMFRADPIVVKSRDSQSRAIRQRDGFRRVIEPKAQALFMYR
jgi:hypothetical protein